MKLSDIFKKKNIVGLTTDMKERERLVSQTLTQMNCAHTWEDDHEERVATFDYQNGHFRIRVEKDTPYVRLMFLFFYTTKLNNLQIVRHICNQCNLNSECERVVYSTNAEKSEVDVHAMTGVLLHSGKERETLARAMQNMFSWQNAFVRRFEEMIKEDGKEGGDTEVEAVKWEHEMSLLREMELVHPQGESIRVAADEDERSTLTLAQLAKLLFAFKDCQFQGIEILEGPMQLKTLNPEQADALTLRMMVDDNGTLVNRCTALVSFRDGLSDDRTVMVLIRHHGGNDHSSYYRITMTIEPLSARYHIVPFSWNKKTVQSVSVLFAFDQVTDKQRDDEFRYLWKEALGKAKSGDTSSLTEEQKLICEIVDDSVAKNLFLGRRMFDNNCFAQALYYLEKAYSQQLQRIDSMKNSQRERFLEVCYLIGFCYAELKQYDRAIYYLDITSPARRITYTTEQVNCMIHAHDVRVEQMIDGLIGELEMKYDDDDDDEDHESPMLNPNVRQFYHFLRRRKVYLLIERESYPMARSMLNAMLNEPENNDFAINELAYLQRVAPKASTDDLPLPF